MVYRSFFCSFSSFLSPPCALNGILRAMPSFLFFCFVLGLARYEPNRQGRPSDLSLSRVPVRGDRRCFLPFPRCLPDGAKNETRRRNLFFFLPDLFSSFSQQASCSSFSLNSTRRYRIVLFLFFLLPQGGMRNVVVGLLYASLHQELFLIKAKFMMEAIPPLSPLRRRKQGDIASPLPPFSWKGVWRAWRSL